jgi:hypothetical protein
MPKNRGQLPLIVAEAFSFGFILISDYRRETVLPQARRLSYVMLKPVTVPGFFTNGIGEELIFSLIFRHRFASGLH